MNYLITGGAGFIGSNIAKRLVKEGESVRIIDNFSTGKRENIGDISGKVEIVDGDIRDIDTVSKAVRDMDFIIHQAALPSVPRSVKDPLTSNSVNVTGTLNLLNAAKEAKIKRFVYASSSSVYGDTPVLPKREDMPPNPQSPYAVTKLTGEYYCSVFYRVYRLPTVSLRYFNVFGPNQDPQSQYAAVIPRFITAILSQKSPIVFGDGEQSRDFTFIENVVEANLLSCKNDNASGKIFNIACGNRYTINTLLNELYSLSGKKVEPVYSEPRSGDIRHSHAEISRARDIIGYKPGVDFRDGLKRTVEWFKRETATD
ncbi:MAG: SDR family oxidoreductase [Nitrospinae bacterium]|nr:SDR family oxidoreductase [Nitrospinota bacterium]MBI3813929.1 SDR family oxidoreductase [Nitrospinota bacterium]